MTAPLLAGALAGLGVFLLAMAIAPPAPGLGLRLARLDAARALSSRGSAAVGQGADGGQGAGGAGDRGDVVDRWRGGLANRLEAVVESQGLQLPRVRADLAVLGRPLGAHLATKVFFAVGALVWTPLLWATVRLFGVPLPGSVPVVLGLALAAVAFFLPDLQLHSEAQQRRKDFRHVMGSYLDLVAMNLAGGRGLPEAVTTSAGIGDHWAMVRIRQTLATARLVGLTPWEALGRLGRDIGVDELTELAGALTLAGDEGAKIRASLSARAESLRRKELAEAEGAAGERSQSMLIAQLLLCAAFLLFLAFPAAYNILTSV